MVSSTPAANDPSLPPPPKTAGGTYTIQQVSVGCKIYITRPAADGETEERLAEILSIRDKTSNPYAPRPVKSESDDTPPNPNDQYEFFVHWDAFNKRLDEWVSGSRLVLSKDLEWPRPKPPPVPKKLTGAAALKVAPSKGTKARELLKKATANAAATASTSAVPTTPSTPVAQTGTPLPRDSPSPSPGPSTPSTPSLKRKVPHDEEEADEPSMLIDDEDEDAEGEMDIDADEDLTQAASQPDTDTTPVDTDAPASPSSNSPPPTPVAAAPHTMSKEQEIEKLRTSGSMTQSISEIARVKNLNRLQIGKHEVDAWYFSPYPKEYAHLPILYICEFCLCFFPSSFMLGRHRRRCNLLHPPGNEIYRHEDISFFEIDGRRQVTWCRNLSLLSKCFLDHKTLYYDVTPFLYYVMTQRDSTGCHIIGYFSKEKESAENYNVACILTLPQYQRHGYGRVLIEFSYELTKKEGKLGSPEKPLSDLGLLGYRAYWQEKIIDLLVNTDESEELSIDDIAQRTAITHADVLNTCTTLQLFKHHKGQHLICLNSAVLEKHERTMNKRKRRIVPEKLLWKPPVFTRDQLRFGW